MSTLCEKDQSRFQLLHLQESPPLELWRGILWPCWTDWWICCKSATTSSIWWCSVSSGIRASSEGVVDGEEFSQSHSQPNRAPFAAGFSSPASTPTAPPPVHVESSPVSATQPLTIRLPPIAIVKRRALEVERNTTGEVCDCGTAVTPHSIGSVRCAEIGCRTKWVGQFCLFLVQDSSDRLTVPFRVCE